jgi:hypothetical protein
MDRERIERCLAQVAAYQASGQKAKHWAAANGVSIRELASWSAHARRWQSQLDGVAVPEPASRSHAGFVAATLPAAASASVRVEIGAASGATPLVLHWPVGAARELAAWVREVRR